MQLVLDSVYKAYEGKSIFKGYSFTFEPGRSYALSGANGVGKTSLLKLILGYAKPDKGTINWLDKGNTIDPVYTDFAFAGVQLELVEDLLVEEAWNFHFMFRNPQFPTYQRVFNEVFSADMRRKKINQLSAGWYTRLKVMMALFTECKLLILDEPFSNFDETGIRYFSALIQQHKGDRILIVAGNRADELALCEAKIHLV
jgi:ABC-type multidrug transport system ATPase subunit